MLVPHWPDLPANVGALATTRDGGVSAAPYDDGNGGGGLNLGTHVGDDAAAVAQNRALVAAHLPAAPVWLSQVRQHRGACRFSMRCHDSRLFAGAVG
jgi:copper oxidase (laccase) domain-containing protein